ncbi:hypothetical protein PSQ90_00545 [Devosia rhodophyticola]|uniref:Uncharacterized protein n=1 Tax=Devosia rhodophyticola TaxID=3026423 RepID=A0ABY7YX78_9HYPH|nr:hypothetical protein [Devosia rhodophyticola]WDR05990.1 hypothetical protein PSQ90_00545 [Devosia rhodophyticola]
MLLIIFLVLILALFQAFLPGKYLVDQVGPESQMGPRDNLPRQRQNYRVPKTPCEISMKPCPCS